MMLPKTKLNLELELPSGSVNQQAEKLKHFVMKDKMKRGFDL